MFMSFLFLSTVVVYVFVSGPGPTLGAQVDVCLSCCCLVVSTGATLGVHENVCLFCYCRKVPQVLMIVNVMINSR